MSDMSPLSNGHMIQPYYPSESLIIDDPDWIENFQITQERIVPRAEPTAERGKYRFTGAAPERVR